jgi:hypothetical protein
MVYSFHLAEVKGVVQLLEHDQLGALSGKVDDAVAEAAHVVLDRGDIVLLDDSYFDFFHDMFLY